MANTKIKLTTLLEFLRQETDMDHPATTNQIIKRMVEQGVSCDRKTLARDVALLNERGYEVMKTRVGHENAYYVEDRDFDVAELKLLIDAVQAASFVTEKKTEALVKKIAQLGGSHQAEILNGNLVRFNTRKHSNEQIYFNIFAIEEAIQKQCKAIFLYYDLNENKEKIYRRDGHHYINDWYARRKSSKVEGVDILIDISSTNADDYRKDPEKMLRRMKKRLRDYFVEMDGGRESLARTDRAKTEEEIIGVYVDWYYVKYLYHHNEQFLDLFEFITNNVGSDREDITNAIRDYFSLPFVKLKSDEAIFSEMSLQEISDKIVSGVSRATISNIERININRYSYKLDYMLFCANLRYNGVFEASRLERVIKNASRQEQSIIGCSFAKLYRVCETVGKILILNYIEENGSLFGITISEFVKSAYADGARDTVYYGILAQRLNTVYDGIGR